MTGINLSNNGALQILDASFNSISSIDVSNCSSLVSFNISFNQVADLNLNSNTSLQNVYVNNNLLSNLTFNNGNNYGLNNFNATNNPGLNCISVDDVQYMYSAWNGSKDVAAIYSLDCSRSNFNMTNGNASTCSAFFHDSGGPANAYSDFENSIFTFYPDIPGQVISVGFFNLELGEGDTLKIYNGDNTSATLLGRYTSGNIPSFPINSSSVTGALTFEFTSDLINTSNGWLAEINCIPTYVVPDCVGIHEPADGANNVPLNQILEWKTDIGSAATSYALFLGNSPNPPLTNSIDVPYYYNGLWMPNTTYYWMIDPSNSEGNPGSCLEYSFTTGYVVDACDANASTGDGGEIGNVEISYIGYGNPTGPSIDSYDLSGYSDYTNLTPIDIGIGLSYNLTVTNNDPEPNGGCGIYIDWNQDGDFFDTDEFLVVNGNFGAGPYTAVISPPVGTSPGYVRMRIRLSIEYYINPCGDDFYGEVEDYVLNLHPTCIVNIPDPNFKNYLVNHPGINLNGDAEIECSEAAAYTGAIIVNNLGIADMTGIEAFVQLTSLECGGNSITDLDLTSNAALSYLACYDNLISNLNISGINNLEIIKAENNQLLNLDFSSHTGLEYLYINNNIISALDLTNNPNLIGLGCEENQLSSLDLSNNAGLQFLIGSENQFSVFDASGLALLDYIELNNNQLTELNIQNGNNLNLVQFSALNNPLLTCIKVDDVAFMDANWSGGKDATAIFSLSCGLIPEFSADDTVICVNLPITFSDLSTGTSVSTTYFWDFGAGAAPATANTVGPHVVTYTSPGLKTVSLSLTDGVSVVETKVDYIEITSPATLPISQVDETCTLANASIDLTLTGGTAPFTFAWDNGATTEDISGLAANTYNVVVTDNNGCIANATATITNAATATLSTTQVDETCSSSNGSIDLTISGGTAPFTFAWDNGAITEDIGGLAANTYNVVVTDFNGCIANTSATITNSPTATLSTTQVDETCSAANGSIDLTVTGGTGPFTFAWDNGAVTEDIGGLAANTYNVVVTDNNGCIANASATLTNAATATLSTTQIDPTCGASNGSVDLTVTGGTAPFTFAWDNGAITEDIGALAANTYNVIVTDNNGCIANASVTLNNTGGPVASTTQVDETCSASNGSIDLTIVGGTAPFTFAWDNGAVTEDISGLAANTYNVVVTDFNGCVANASATITNSPTATLSTTQVDETCSAANGSIDLTVTGGTAPFTFAWDNGAVTEDISGLAANTYNVVVTDFNGCIANTSATITNSPTATLSTTQVDETCSASNGSIDLTVTGGTAPFTFAWDNGAVTEDISGLAANTYNVVVTDFNGCVANTSATISNSPTATLSTTQVDETCSAANGSIDLTVTGGTAPFTFAWDNGAVTEDISGLTANTYNVVVTDFNGCVANTSATITNSPTATLSSTQVDETCSASNGSIDLTVTGGTAPFTFAWDNGAVTEDISGLAANTYNVVVTDFNGCVANTSATITNSPTATLSTTQVDETCSASNGSIDLTVTGGTAPFTFAWDNGAVTEDISGLAANTYNVVVTDFNGCVANTSATITNSPTATLSTTQVDETCSAANGSIDLTVTGGTGPFTFAWDNGAVTEDISGLAANTYNVVVTDFNGCVANTSATIINSPTATLSTTQVDETCSAANGSIDLTVTGGTAPFTFAWDNGAVTEDISGLAANTYNVVVTDFNGCVANASATITNSPTATLSTTQVDETCSAANGSIDLMVTGGTGPFTFAWDNGAVTEDISGLAANTYNVVVTDFNGCVANTSATITNAPTATLSTTQVDETCSAANGSIDLTVTGGTGPFTFAWDNGAVTEDISGLAANTYNVVVTDFNGCVANASATITNSPTATLSTTQVDETCSAANGSIDLTVTGGTGPFTFAWDNGAVTEDISGLAANTYNVVVTDFNGCVANTSATITNSPTATLSTTQVDETCSAANGSIDLTVTGGTAPFTFAWDNGSVTEDISGLAANTYNVVVTDFNGCVANTSATITNSPTATLSTTQVDETCSASNGSIDLTVTGGTGPFTFAWDNGAVTEDISGLAANTYNVVVTDFNGCVANTSATITNSPTATLSTTQVDETCSAANGSIDLTVTGGTGPFTFAWDNGAVTEDISGLAANTYNVVVTDFNGCVANTSATITNSPTATLSSTQVDETCSASNGSIDLTVTGGNAPFTYAWDNGAVTEDISGLAANTYNVVVTDFNGCVANTSATITNSPTATLSTTQVDETCSAANGSIDLTVTGGTGPFTFAWDNGAVTEDIGGLVPNTYNVVVTDFNGCVANTSATILSIGGPTAVSLNTYFETCSASNGSVKVTGVTGGTIPFNYSLDGITYAASDSIFGLSANNYTMFVQDANLCVVTQAFVITDLAAPSAATLNLYDETCGAANGAFQVTSVTGNAAPYLFSTDGITYSAIDTLSGLSAQGYNLFIQDTNNCVYTQAFTINNIAGPSGTITTVYDETCTAGNGVLDINGITGGTAPYLYSLDGVTYTANDSLTAFVAGNYTLYVTDVNNCLYTEAFVINDLAGPTALTYGLQTAACGLNVGVIDITAVTGGNAPYTYSTDGINYAANDSIINLAGGAYTIFVSDSNNCIYSEPFNIASTPAAVATASNDTSICLGSSATLIASGGNIYSWDNGAGNTASVTVSPAASTLYTVTVTDANNCSATEQVQVNVNALPAAPVITANGPLTFCQGNTVTLFSSYTGGNTWTGGSTLDSLVVAASGSVILNYTDVNGCSNEDTVNVNVNPLPIVNLSGPVYVCEGTAAIALSGGTPIGGTYSGNGVNAGNFDPLVTGAGTFDFYYSFTDANACVNSDTAQIVVNAKPVLSLSNDSLFFCLGNSASVISEVSPAGGVYSGTGVANNAFDPGVSGEGVFTLNYAYMDGNGCTNSIDMVAQVGTLDVILPNYFTGNKGVPIALSAASNYFRGGASFTYTWEPSNLFSDPSSATPLVTTAIDTTISVTINDGYCSASSSAKVKVVDPDVIVTITTSNPGTGSFDIVVDNGKDYRDMLVDVYNIMGSKTNSYSFSIIPGKNIVPFNLYAENDGTYVLHIIIGNTEKMIKVVKTEK